MIPTRFWKPHSGARLQRVPNLIWNTIVAFVTRLLKLKTIYFRKLVTYFIEILDVIASFLAMTQQTVKI
jgi:hypothetical protein